MWSAVHVGAPEPIPSTPVVPAPIPSLVQIAAPTAPRQLRPSPGRSGLALREPARRRDAARDPPSIRRALPSMPAIGERDAPGSAGGRPTRFVAVLRLKVCPPRRSSTASRQVRSSCCSSRSGRPRNAEKFGFSPGPRSHLLLVSASTLPGCLYQAYAPSQLQRCCNPRRAPTAAVRIGWAANCILQMREYRMPRGLDHGLPGPGGCYPLASDPVRRRRGPWTEGCR